MIAKIFLLWFCINCFTTALATTQYYYLTTTGAGKNAGDTGSWDNVPNTEDNAMSAKNFNDPNNWSDTDSESKLDADDVVFVKGSWGWGYDLTVNKPIIIDFYESGDYDPINMDHSILPVYKSKIYIKSNDVTIRDGRFGLSPRAIIVEELTKIQRLKILKNYFDVTMAGGWAAVYWGFVCDSEYMYNYVEGIPQSNCDSSIYGNNYGGRSIVINAGSRNKIMYNYIDGGFTGIYFPGARTWDSDPYTVDYPSYGKYTADPDVNYLDNEISYNHIERRCQEGISYDMTSNNYSCSIIERDVVASINGKIVTLNNSGGEWTGKGNLYSGYYMVATPNRDDAFGNHALVEEQSENTFTLKNEIDNLKVGDTIVISMIFKNNWIHHNTFGKGGFNGSSILLMGTALENLIEHNTFPQVDWTEGMGIHVSSPDGYVKAFGSVTKTYASCPSAYNIVRNNICERIQNSAYNYGYGTTSDIFTRNNAFYDNTILKNQEYPRYLILNKANAYVNNSGKVSIDNGGSLRATDPTEYVAAYFDKWNSKSPSPLSAPLGVTVQIKK